MNKKTRSFKNSGVTWIGYIPEDWKINRNKHFFKKSKNVVGENSSIYKVLSLTKQGVIERDIESNSGKMPASFDIYQIIHPNSLLLCLFDIDVTPRTIGFVEQTGIVSSAYTNIDITRNDIFPKYYYYWFLMLDMDKRLLHLTKNLRYSINIDEFMDLPVIKPSIKEQQSIVDFLDKKTQQIDVIMQKKQKLMNVLQEKRQSLIEEAVTKGLNREVPMKDSGIEWLGAVPANWKLKKFKHIVSMVGGGTPSKDNLEYWDGEIPWVSPKDMKVDYIDSSEDGITQLGLNNSSTTLIDKPSVLMVARSGILKHTLPVAINIVPVSLNQDMKALTPKKDIGVNYLFWVLKGIGSYVLSSCKKIGATVESIETEDLNKLMIPVPPIEEQMIIIEKIKTKTDKIDLLVKKINDQIEKLQEYRQALINEAVTGKIDVREYTKEVIE